MGRADAAHVEPDAGRSTNRQDNMTDDVQVKCSHCRRDIVVEASAQGFTILCPKCGCGTLVPRDVTRCEFSRHSLRLHLMKRRMRMLVKAIRRPFCGLVAAALLWWLGREVLTLSWFGNITFAFLGATALVYAVPSVLGAILFPRRVRDAMDVNKDKAQRVIEERLGLCPPDPNRSDDEAIGLFVSIVPFAIVVAAKLPVPSLLKWACGIAGAIPCTALLFWITNPRRLLARAKRIVEHVDWEAWRTIEGVWDKRRPENVKAEIEQLKQRLEDAAREAQGQELLRKQEASVREFLERYPGARPRRISGCEFDLDDLDHQAYIEIDLVMKLCERCHKENEHLHISESWFYGGDRLGDSDSYGRDHYYCCGGCGETWHESVRLGD